MIAASHRVYKKRQKKNSHNRKDLCDATALLHSDIIFIRLDLRSKNIKNCITEMGQAPLPKTAVAVFSMNDVTGKAVFVDEENTVKIYVRLTGVPPGEHGLHVHQCGDISGEGCKLAGSHYNPGNKAHGGAHGSPRHPGDLGNVVADKFGIVRVDVTVRYVSLRDIVGRSLVLHVGRDDLGLGKGEAKSESLKTGNSGGRLACAVIGWSKC